MATEGELVIAAMSQWQKKFDDHTTEEMARYREILNLIRTGQDSSEKRHATTTKKLNELSDVLIQHVADTPCHEPPCEHLKKTIYKEDFGGHREVHATDAEAAEEKKELVREVKKQAWSSIAIAAIGVTGYALWDYAKAALHKL